MSLILCVLDMLPDSMLFEPQASQSATTHRVLGKGNSNLVVAIEHSGCIR